MVKEQNNVLSIVLIAGLVAVVASLITLQLAGNVAKWNPNKEIVTLHNEGFENVAVNGNLYQLFGQIDGATGESTITVTLLGDGKDIPLGTKRGFIGENLVFGSGTNTLKIDIANAKGENEDTYAILYAY